MRLTQSVAFGLVSLVCNINASITTAKPVLAKRQGPGVTVSQNGCTAVCIDSPIEGLGYACDVYCDQTSSTKMPATSTYTSTLRSTVTSTVKSKAKATLTQRSVVSANTAACHEVCSVNEAEGDIDCSFSCGLDFSTAMPAALHQRTVVSAVQNDCTAVCWDLMPGTECDVQCSSDFKTAMPVGFAAPSKAVRVADLPARENVQAHRVHEARLARKFGGVVVRDANGRTITSTLWGPTLTSTITLATIMPLQVPQTAEAPAPPALLSQASAAISAAQQVSPTFASVLSVDSKVDSLLSAVFATSHTSAVPTSSALKVSTTITAISTALETTIASATSSKTTPALDTVSETTTALVISSKTTTVAATSPKTTTAIAVVSETTTEFVTSSKTTTVAATSPKTTTTAATESETTTASITSSKTTTMSVTASKTTTKSATASKTTTKSTTASETVTSSTTSSDTITASITSTGSKVVAETTIAVYDYTGAAPGYAVSPGLALPILFGLAANAVFLI